MRHQVPFLTLLCCALPTLGFASEVIGSHRSVAAHVFVSDRVIPQECSFGDTSSAPGPYVLDELCSVDTGYGFGELAVQLESNIDPFQFTATGVVTSDSRYNEYWPAFVSMDLVEHVVGEYRLEEPHSCVMTGYITVGSSQDPEFARVSILTGTDFADPVWELSVPRDSTVPVDAAINLGPGDYRIAFSLWYPHIGYSDEVTADFNVVATFSQTVGVGPTAWGSIKALYR